MSKDEDQKPETKVELESEKLLNQIEAIQAGKTPPVKDNSIPANMLESKESESTTSDKATQPTMEKQPAPSTDVLGKAEETKAQDDKKSGKPEVDIREWAKRKGFKENDQESVLKAYREMERKLSQVNAQKEEVVPRGTFVPNGTVPQVPQWQPQPQVPAWQPPPPYYPPQGYQPYIDRRAILEQEAARFNMLPEDLEKFLPLVNEVTQLNTNKMRAELQARYDSQLAQLTRENKRSTEFNELMVDPLFTKPEVAFEIDQIINENPRRLQLEPTPWTNMFKDALERIARKNLQSGNVPEEVVGQTPPSTPPKVGGKSSSPGIPSSNAPNSLIEKFKDLDAKEMEKQLVSLGALPPAH